MKAQSLRGRRTFEMRASSCEEHMQRRVLPQPRRPYVRRWARSAQKVYHGVRVGQPGGRGRHRAPAPPGAGDGARLAGTGGAAGRSRARRSEEHTSELQSLAYLVCRLLLEKKNKSRSSAEVEEF